MQTHGSYTLPPAATYMVRENGVCFRMMHPDPTSTAKSVQLSIIICSSSELIIHRFYSVNENESYRLIIIICTYSWLSRTWISRDGWKLFNLSVVLMMESWIYEVRRVRNLSWINFVRLLFKFLQYTFGKQSLTCYWDSNQR